MNARKALLVALLVALAAAPVRAQEDSLKWWWSPGLGLYASKINEALARDLGLGSTQGLLVLAVARESAAEQAGVKPGDILASYSPNEVWSEDGKDGSLQIVRDGQAQTLSARSRLAPAGATRELTRATAAAREPATLVVDPEGTGNFRTVSAAMFRALPGDSVVLKPGRYAEAVLLRPGVSIRAAEKSLVRVESKTPWLLVGAGGLDLWGVNFSGGGLAVESTEKVAVSECAFVVPEKGAGLLVGNSKAVTVANCTFHGAAETVGVSAHGSQILVSESVFAGHGSAAILLTRGARAEARDNLIDGNARAVVAEDSELEASKNVIAGTWAPGEKDERPNFGFQLLKCTATLSKNSIRQHRYGIFVSDAPAPAKIIESTVTQAEYGIVLLASPAAVTGSLILQNQRVGVYVANREKDAHPKPQEVTLFRNTLSGNEGAAVEADRFDRLTARENLIEANGAGISLWRSAATIENNTVVLQHGAGVRVGAHSHAEIYNNVVAFNSFGFFVDVTARREMGHNNVYGNLARTEFPLLDGNYGRTDRYTTRDGKKVLIDVFPAYDLRAETDLSLDPGFVKLGSDHRLTGNSPLAGTRGKGGHHLGAYPPPGAVTQPARITTISAAASPAPERAVAESKAGGPARRRVAEAESGVAPASGEASTYLDLGDQYMEKGKWDEALAAYKQAIRLAPDDPDAHHALGWAYNEMGRHGEAFAPLVKTLQLDPQYAEAHYGIGQAYLGSDNYAKALGFLKTAVRLVPDSADARYSLALAHLGLGNTEGALEQHDALKRLDPALAQKLHKDIQNFTPPPPPEP